MLYKGQQIDLLSCGVDIEEDTKTKSNLRNLDAEPENINPATQTFTGGTMDAFKSLLKRFMDDMPKSKCENCKANVPTLRSEGVGKIFQVSFSGLYICQKLLLILFNNIDSFFLDPASSAEKQADYKFNEWL